MGCNTSKESVQPAAEDNKDDLKNTGESLSFYFKLFIPLSAIAPTLSSLTDHNG